LFNIILNIEKPGSEKVMTEWRNPRYPEHTLTDHDIEILRAIIKESGHTCSFTDEERQLLKDMASGGKLMKRAVIYLFVALALWAVISDAALKKAAQMMGFIK